MPLTKQQATELAESRKDYFVRYGYVDLGYELAGPFSEEQARDLVRRLFLGPNQDVLVKLFRVVEDYEA